MWIDPEKTFVGIHPTLMSAHSCGIFPGMYKTKTPVVNAQSRALNDRC
jgi:hypothetical protein